MLRAKPQRRPRLMGGALHFELSAINGQLRQSSAAASGFPIAACSWHSLFRFGHHSICGRTGCNNADPDGIAGIVPAVPGFASTANLDRICPLTTAYWRREENATGIFRSIQFRLRVCCTWSVGKSKRTPLENLRIELSY